MKPDGKHVSCEPTAGVPSIRGCLEAFVDSEVDAPRAQVADALATALRSVVHLVDPEAVLLGGSLAHDVEVAEHVAERLRAETLGGRSRPCVVMPSALGADAAAIGAATTVLDAVVADPTRVPFLAESKSA